MRILVLGATGSTGESFVRLALHHGHSVVALVRDPSRLQVSHDHLRAVQGDILNPASLVAAFEQPVDAVVSTLGIYHRRPRTDLSDGTQNVIEAMQTAGCKRMVVVSSLGVGDSKGQGNIIARIIQKLSLPEVLADKERQEAHIRAGDLEWTVVRPPQLTRGDSICEDLVIWQGLPPTDVKLSWKTTRASVANLLLNVLEKKRFINVAVNISEPK